MSGGGRFFGRPRGRFFSTRDEMRRMDRDIELFQSTYGTEVAWYFYRAGASTIDDIYDEGSVTGGKVYDGPVRIPVLSAVPTQGREENDDQGFATYDHITLRLSFEQARKAGFSGNLVQDREQHLLDRFVFRARVFEVNEIQLAGHFDASNRDMVFSIAATQVRPDELVDSPSFAQYSA